MAAVRADDHSLAQNPVIGDCPRVLHRQEAAIDDLRRLGVATVKEGEAGSSRADVSAWFIAGQVAGRTPVSRSSATGFQPSSESKSANFAAGGGGGEGRW